MATTASEQAVGVTVPSPGDLRQWAEHEGLCVSIYSPAHRGPEYAQSRVHLKNRLIEADRALKARGVESAAARDEFLAPGRALVDDAAFWRRAGEGVALLLTAERARALRLPVQVEELTVVADRFHLTPLLQAVDAGTEFFVIAASRKQARWLRGTRRSMDELELPDAPQGMETWDDETSDQLQLHSVGAPEGGTQAAVFHGQGSVERQQEERVLQYFRKLDEAVRKALAGRSAPLVFAGDIGLWPAYRQVQRYPDFVEAFVQGNPEPWTPPEFHARAWPIIEQKLTGDVAAARALVEEALGRGRGSTDPTEIVRNARTGRLQTLLLAAGRHLWGRWDGQESVTPSEVRAPDCEDLVNLCAVLALRTSGQILTLEPSEMPGGAIVAAAYRY